MLVWGNLWHFRPSKTESNNFSSLEIRWQKFPQTIYLSERLIAWLSESTKNHGEGAFVDWGHRFRQFLSEFSSEDVDFLYTLRKRCFPEATFQVGAMGQHDSLDMAPSQDASGK